MIRQQNVVCPVSGRLTDVDVKAVLGFSAPAGLIRRGHSEICKSNVCSEEKQ